jgi:hypothetical protein
MTRPRFWWLLGGVILLFGLLATFLTTRGRSIGDGNLPKEGAADREVTGTLLVQDQIADIISSIESVIDEHVRVTKGGENPPSQRAEIDERWRQLPKQGFDYCTVMRFGPAGISVDRLLRHPLLNPLDKVMSLSEEDELRSFVASGMKEVDKLTQMRGAAISSGMTDLIAKGLTKTRPVAGDAEGVVSMEIPQSDSVKVSNISRIVGGIVHRAAESDMPLVAQLAEMEEFASISMAAAIASWFYNRGFCPESNYSSIITQLSKPQNRFLPRRSKRKDKTR